MRSPSYTGQFKRDVKLAEKRGKDFEQTAHHYRIVVDREWKASHDLHIEPDWVLIYRVDGDAVRFERTGTHSDPFGK